MSSVRTAYPAMVLALLVLALPRPLDAQTWTGIGAVGYRGLGAGLAAAAAWDQSYDQGASTILIGTGAAVVVGALVGRAADRRLARGLGVSQGHGVALVFGATMAGATLGALGSAALINSDGSGTSLGSDETTFALLTAGGAVSGLVFGLTRWNGLRRDRVQFAPIIDDRGRAGFQVRAPL